MTKAAVRKKNHLKKHFGGAANKLRGSVELSEYKHIVLSLDDTFEKRKQELIDAGQGKYVDLV